MLCYYCKKYRKVINRGKFFNNCLPRGCPEWKEIKSQRQLNRLINKNDKKIPRKIKVKAG